MQHGLILKIWSPKDEEMNSNCWSSGHNASILTSRLNVNAFSIFNVVNVVFVFSDCASWIMAFVPRSVLPMSNECKVLLARPCQKKSWGLLWVHMVSAGVYRQRLCDCCNPGIPYGISVEIQIWNGCLTFKGISYSHTPNFSNSVAS